MSLYVSQIQANFPGVFENKRKLNAEFFQQGRITGALSVLYYPLKHGPSTHTQLEVQGRCYTLRSCVGPSPLKPVPEAKSYDGKLCRIRRALIKPHCPAGKATPLGFIRFGIAITPQELQRIEQEIDPIRSMLGITCMHAVARVLNTYTACSPPFPLSIFPSLSALILRFGTEQVASVESHLCHRTPAIRRLDFALGLIPEGLALGCLGLAAKTFLLAASLWLRPFSFSPIIP